MADHARGDFLSKRGTQVITDNLTYTGTGGIDGCSLGDNVDGRLIGIPFYLPAITAGDTGDDLGSAGLCGSSTITDWVAPKAGSIVGISLNANTACATGHVSAIGVVGATDTAVVAELNTVSTLTAYTNAAKDSATFAAGKALSVKIMLGNTTSTANHVCGSLIIEM